MTSSGQAPPPPDLFEIADPPRSHKATPSTEDASQVQQETASHFIEIDSGGPLPDDNPNPTVAHERLRVAREWFQPLFSQLVDNGVVNLNHPKTNTAYRSGTTDKSKLQLLKVALLGSIAERSMPTEFIHRNHCELISSLITPYWEKLSTLLDTVPATVAPHKFMEPMLHHVAAEDAELILPTLLIGGRRGVTRELILANWKVVNTYPKVSDAMLVLTAENETAHERRSGSQAQRDTGRADGDAPKSVHDLARERITRLIKHGEKKRASMVVRREVDRRKGVDSFADLDDARVQEELHDRFTADGDDEDFFTPTTQPREGSTVPRETVDNDLITKWIHSRRQRGASFTGIRLRHWDDLFEHGSDAANHLSVIITAIVEHCASGRYPAILTVAKLFAEKKKNGKTRFLQCANSFAVLASNVIALQAGHILAEQAPDLLGSGVPHGVESVPTLVQAIMDDNPRPLIALLDFTAAFDIANQSIITDWFSKHCSTALPFVMRILSCPQLGINGRSLTALFQVRGTPQGDPISVIFFNIILHRYLSDFPLPLGVGLRSIADDVTLVIHDYHYLDVTHKLQQWLRTLTVEGPRYGLVLNARKTMWVVDLTEETRADATEYSDSHGLQESATHWPETLELLENFELDIPIHDISEEPLRLVGGIIGRNAIQASNMLIDGQGQKFFDYTFALRDLFAKHNPLMFHNMYTSCAQPMMTFVMRTTSPELIQRCLQRLDERLASDVFASVYGHRYSHRTQPTGGDLHELASVAPRLPMRRGGLNLYRFEEYSLAAHAGSTLDSMLLNCNFLERLEQHAPADSTPGVDYLSADHFYEAVTSQFVDNVSNLLERAGGALLGASRPRGDYVDDDNKLDRTKFPNVQGADEESWKKLEDLLHSDNKIRAPIDILYSDIVNTVNASQPTKKTQRRVWSTFTDVQELCLKAHYADNASALNLFRQTNSKLRTALLSTVSPAHAGSFAHPDAIRESIFRLPYGFTLSLPNRFPDWNCCTGCHKPVSSMPISHVTNCMKIVGRGGATYLHNLLKSEILSIGASAGLPGLFEPFITGINSRNGTTGNGNADGAHYMKNELHMFDVTVMGADETKELDQLIKVREETKNATYKDACERQGIKFSPIVVTTLGTIGPAGKKYLKLIIANQNARSTMTIHRAYRKLAWKLFPAIGARIRAAAGVPITGPARVSRSAIIRATARTPNHSRPSSPTARGCASTSSPQPVVPATPSRNAASLAASSFLAAVGISSTNVTPMGTPSQDSYSDDSVM